MSIITVNSQKDLAHALGKWVSIYPASGGMITGHVEWTIPPSDSNTAARLKLEGTEKPIIIHKDTAVEIAD